MAEYINLLSITEKADADLSAKQYFLVKQNANGVVLAALNDAAIGALQDKPKTGEFGRVQVAGVAKVKAGAAINKGDYVKSDANGKAIASAGEAAGTLVHIVGQALEAATADGDVISVLLAPSVINRAVS